MSLFAVRRRGRPTTAGGRPAGPPTATPAEKGPPNSGAPFGVSRIAALSDGIFAIAITLLIFGLEVPEISQPTSSDELGSALGDMWPRFAAYFQTFLIVGAFWVGHHRAFRRMVREDDRLAWLNLLFLLTVSFMPFPSNLVGRYPENRTAVVVYSASLGAVSVTYAAVWAYAVGARLLASSERPAARIELWTAGSAGALFLLSVPLAFADLDLAALCSNAVVLVLVLASRSHRQIRRREWAAGASG